MAAAALQNSTTFTPGFIAWKSLLPGPESSGYSFVTSDSALIEAEANALPGSWKFFAVPGGTSAPNYDSQGQAAAKWAGVSYSGPTSNPTPGHVAGEAAAAAGHAAADALGLGALFQRNIWLRVVEVLAGLTLLAIGLNSMLSNKPLRIVTNTVGMAARVVPK